MNIKEITASLEAFAPLSFQENYDNAGLITGDLQWECSGIITTLDATEAVVDEAIANKCNLIVAHHPIVFGGLKKITSRNYIERTVIKAIKNDIAIYAIHTNLDNVMNGVNRKIAEKIGLKDLQILQPKEALLKKLITFAPVDKADEIRNAIFSAGAGNIGKYDQCSFNTPGEGTFRAGEGADPYVGEKGKVHREQEIKIEVILPAYLQQKVVRALIDAHPYEEVAFDIFPLGYFLTDVGSGMVGQLPQEQTDNDFLALLKESFNLKVVRHTGFTGKKIKKVAVCGGAGFFLLEAAKSAGADVFITSDIKYHEFFDADGQLLLADIGHYESEQFTTDLLFDLLTQNFPNFAVLKTGVNTNPVQYF